MPQIVPSSQLKLDNPSPSALTSINCPRIECHGMPFAFSCLATTQRQQHEHQTSRNGTTRGRYPRLVPPSAAPAPGPGRAHRHRRPRPDRRRCLLHRPGGHIRRHRPRRHHRSDGRRRRLLAILCTIVRRGHPRHRAGHRPRLIAGSVPHLHRGAGPRRHPGPPPAPAPGRADHRRCAGGRPRPSHRRARFAPRLPRRRHPPVDPARPARTSDRPAHQRRRPTQHRARPGRGGIGRAADAARRR